MIPGLMSHWQCYRMPPDRGLVTQKQSGVKGNKTRLTYAFTTNADGSEKLIPFVIGKVKKPRAFEKKTGQQLGFLYRTNANAWMTAELYKEWIENWDRELRRKNRKILLLQDNFAGHIVPEHLQNIRVENFHANLTAHVQPNDQGIIRCFKAHYRSKYIQRSVDRYEEGITPSDIYSINQLEAMRLADAAWDEVDVTTIRHCWIKAGILPTTELDNSPIWPRILILSLINDTSVSPDPIQQAEIQVEKALDVLVSTGALQSTNRMNLEALLNSDLEQTRITIVSDEEIYEAVMESRKAEELSSLNDGHDGLANNSDELVLPCPNRCEVLQAASTLTRYTNTLDSPSARKIESLLSALKHQMQLEFSQNSVDALITDYFPAK